MAARLVVLISGRGRNLAALIEAIGDGRIPARIVAVVSSRADAAGLATARAAGLRTEVLAPMDHPDRVAYDRALGALLTQLRPDLVVLAGFMRLLGAELVEAWAGRMLNIHPSLLPRHRGLRTHAAVLAAGDPAHGATVHFVTPGLDEGPAIVQGQFSVRPEDDAESLARRTLETVELKIYPQAVAWFARGELTLVGDAVEFRGRPLQSPLTLDALEDAFR